MRCSLRAALGGAVLALVVAELVWTPPWEEPSYRCHFEVAMTAVFDGTEEEVRLVQRLFSQIERILRINALQTITQEGVEAAREHLVVGSLP